MLMEPLSSRGQKNEGLFGSRELWGRLQRGTWHLLAKVNISVGVFTRRHRHHLWKQHKASYLNKVLRDRGWHPGFPEIQAAGPGLSTGRLLPQQALYPSRPPNQRSSAGLSGCPGLL